MTKDTIRVLVVEDHNVVRQGLVALLNLVEGIDVVGDSPVLKGNQVLQARVAPFHVQDFTQPNGQTIHSQPLLEKNQFQTTTTAVASQAAPH